MNVTWTAGPAAGIQPTKIRVNGQTVFEQPAPVDHYCSSYGECGLPADAPVVGLTVGDPTRAQNYEKALHAAGVHVRRLDYRTAYNAYPSQKITCQMQGLKGLVLTGGGDIDPALQGLQQPYSQTLVGVDPRRDLYERAVFEEAWKQDVPVLGICRGSQLINWSLGGTLVQDIDTEVAPHNAPKGHRQIDRGIPKTAVTEPIHLEAGSHVGQMFGASQIGVNHDHHQAIKDVAPDLKVTARASDGIVEAVEARDRTFVVGLQFHPELLWQGDATYLKPFQAFADNVLAAR